MSLRPRELAQLTLPTPRPLLSRLLPSPASLPARICDTLAHPVSACASGVFGLRKHFVLCVREQELSKDIKADLAACMQNIGSQDDDDSVGTAGTLSVTDEDEGGVEVPGEGKGGAEDAAYGDSSAALTEEVAATRASKRF